MRLLAAVPLMLAATPVGAVEPLDTGWSEVAVARDGECALRVTGNGQAYRIAGSGLKPGEDARYVVTNGDMKPLDWQVRADGNGHFARYYLPFRWHRRGDTVTVQLRSSGCRIATAFGWRRAEVAVR